MRVVALSLIFFYLLVKTFHQWGSLALSTKLINVSWPLLKVPKRMFRALALRLSPWRRANARNVRFETLYGGQFTLSTQLIIPNYPDILFYRRSTTVSLETCPIYSVPHKWFATFQAVTTIVGHFFKFLHSESYNYVFEIRTWCSASFKWTSSVSSRYFRLSSLSRRSDKRR